ncbi:hypothetical protein BDV18DRAFT_153033 [Aspergillus unguis]
MTNSGPLRIIIVGGGIAGLSAAIALRAPGRQITILERSRLNREIGALISLQPNASRILRETWNLGEEMAAARGLVDEGIRIYDTDGSLVNEIPLLSKTEYGARRAVYHRNDLHSALKSAATGSSLKGDPAAIQVSSSVVSCDPEGGQVTLESGEILTADVIIGADGIHSVLRKCIPSEVLEANEPEFCKRINPRDPYTSIVVAHDCRLVMGPGRQGEMIGIVAMVPDDKMNEDPASGQSWVTEGSMEKMLETFSEFPSWLTSIFKHSPDLGLWQLRDMAPFKTWYRGRVFLIGDAAHPMLPTQGQGASQSIEDAEALGAFFEDLDTTKSPSLDDLQIAFEQIFKARYDRASVIQRYSRQTAQGGTVKGQKTVTLNPEEFMDYNCMYRGAKLWSQSKAGSQAVSVI